MRRLRQTLKIDNPRVVFLMETKLDVYHMKKVRLKCGFTNGIEVGADGSHGGLCMAWKEDSVIDLQSSSINHIDAILADVNGEKIRCFTGFYGAPVVRDHNRT